MQNYVFVRWALGIPEYLGKKGQIVFDIKDAERFSFDVGKSLEVWLVAPMYDGFKLEYVYKGHPEITNDNQTKLFE